MKLISKENRIFIVYCTISFLIILPFALAAGIKPLSGIDFYKSEIPAYVKSNKPFDVNFRFFTAKPGKYKAIITSDDRTLGELDFLISKEETWIGLTRLETRKKELSTPISISEEGKHRIDIIVLNSKEVKVAEKSIFVTIY